MSINRQDVEAIAHLARLNITEDTISATTHSVQEVLALVGQLQAADTDNVAPLAHPLDAVQRLRADEVTETDQRESLQANAPAVEAGLFLVPQVIE